MRKGRKEKSQMSRYASLTIGWAVLLQVTAGAQNVSYSVVSKPLPISQAQAASGLKEALVKGVGSAVQELGHQDGFLTNLAVRIPMPQELATVERTLRALGESRLADEFVAAMNHAAEQAVPQAVSVFTDAISKMTLGDVTGILTGPPDAATQYFRRSAGTNLFARFEPVVQQVTEATGVTASYKRLLQMTESNKYLGALLGAVSNPQALDLDGYITNKAMDGLFKEIAAEEQRIRQDSVERTSQLLRQVFGALSR